MNLKTGCEAALFVSGRNMSPADIGKVFGIEDSKLVKAALEELVTEYKQRDTGIEVVKIGGKYVMRCRQDIEEDVLQLIPETEMPKAMLKTLALIAYEQPVKQSHLIKLRGNRCYVYLKRLEEQDFIKRKPEGHTRILTTTPKFNKYFRINDAKELVKADLRAKADDAVRKVMKEDEKAQTKLETEEGESVKYDMK
ncbi:SMC-Scp complex subunit ScpB [Candidatus Altiarchaeota archaeon]